MSDLFVSLREVRLASVTSSEIVTVPACKPTRVPSSLQSEAIKTGCIPFDPDVHSALIGEKPHAVVQPDSGKLGTASEVSPPEQLELPLETVEEEPEPDLGYEDDEGDLAPTEFYRTIYDTLCQLQAEGLVKSKNGRVKNSVLQERLPPDFEPVTAAIQSEAIRRCRQE